MYIVSACLLGHNCKYSGGNNLSTEVVNFLEDKEVIVICPETAGGLKAPRAPAEQIAGRVIDREGKDLTENFLKGAYASLDKVKETLARSGREADGAILKANSPSCGYRKIYDGSFTGTLIDGNGIFTGILENELGIHIMTEKDFKE